MKIKLPSLPKLQLRRSPDPTPSMSASGMRAVPPSSPEPVGVGGFGDRLRLVNRRLRGAAGYVFLFVVVFFVFVWVSLPTRAIAWRIGQTAREAGYIIDIEDMSVSPFGGVTLYNVRWTFQPSHAGQIPRTLELPEVDVDVGVIGLLMGDYDVVVDTKIDEATIHAEYTKSEEESTVKLSITELQLYDVPKLQQSVNAPLAGLFGLEVDLTLPENKFAKAAGEISLSCAACKIGDGVTPLYMPGSSGIMAKGVTLPEIDLGSLGGKLVVADGKATAEKFETTSDDLTLKITGGLKLSDPFSKSEFELDLKLLVTQALQDRSEPLKLMVQTAGPSSKLDGADEGWLGFKLRGSPGRPKFSGLKAKSREERAKEAREKAKEREAKRKAKKPTTKKDTKETDEKAADSAGDAPDSAARPETADGAVREPEKTDERADERRDEKTDERRDERPADKPEDKPEEKSDDRDRDRDEAREQDKPAEQPEEPKAEDKPADNQEQPPPAEGENQNPEGAPREGEGGGGQGAGGEAGGGGGEAQ
ncbi:MAG: type II secretion system protein GspN [Myxococcales bacterium]|nr:type II secretion system protein GspN [Myxococcales bacterium]